MEVETSGNQSRVMFKESLGATCNQLKLFSSPSLPMNVESFFVVVVFIFHCLIIIVLVKNISSNSLSKFPRPSTIQKFSNT